MNYQVKGISGYVWGVRGCARVCAGVRGCEQVCLGVHGCARICVGVHKCAQVCVHGCGMNFQNFFWRIESIHQRTLIRILYEFFLLTFT